MLFVNGYLSYWGVVDFIAWYHNHNAILHNGIWFYVSITVINCMTEALKNVEGLIVEGGN